MEDLWAGNRPIKPGEAAAGEVGCPNRRFAARESITVYGRMEPSPPGSSPGGGDEAGPPHSVPRAAFGPQGPGLCTPPSRRKRGPHRFGSRVSYVGKRQVLAASRSSWTGKPCGRSSRQLEKYTAFCWRNGPTSKARRQHQALTFPSTAKASGSLGLYSHCPEGRLSPAFLQARESAAVLFRP